MGPGDAGPSAGERLVCEVEGVWMGGRVGEGRQVREATPA